MKFVNHCSSNWLWLIFLGLNAVECSLIMDLVNNFASSGVSCLVLVSELDAETDLRIDTANVSRFSVAQYDTNASLPHISTAGKYCLYNLLIFDSVESSLQFLNRYKVYFWMCNCSYLC